MRLTVFGWLLFGASIGVLLLLQFYGSMLLTCALLLPYPALLVFYKVIRPLD